MRAMEIIDELESVRRGLYGGAVGYMDFGGNMDFCITIRTMIKKGDRVYMQAGAGIVADSDPEQEYQECCNKVRGACTNFSEGGKSMILLIDNYDSFTYNLYQYMGIFDRDIQVVRNDKITVDEIKKRSPEKIVLSPGPKSPEDAGICVDVVRKFYDKIPILGICLGHQSIGAAFGAEIVHAKALMHGKQSLITHSGRGIFRGIPNPVRVARYHSLAVDEKTLSPDFEILARN